MINVGLHEMKLEANNRTLIQFSCAANKTVNDDLFADHLLDNICQKHTDVTDLFRHINEKVALARRRELRKLYPMSLNGLREDVNIYLNYASDCTFFY